MIRGFDCKITKKLWEGVDLSQKERRKMGDLDWEKALINLHKLNSANEQDLISQVALKYHKVGANYSIDVKRNSKWRILFRWIVETNSEGAIVRENVELVRISDETHK